MVEAERAAAARAAAARAAAGKAAARAAAARAAAGEAAAGAEAARAEVARAAAAKEAPAAGPEGRDSPALEEETRVAERAESVVEHTGRDTDSEASRRRMRRTSLDP
jgi:hypothetical protein